MLQHGLERRWQLKCITRWGFCYDVGRDVGRDVTATNCHVAVVVVRDVGVIVGDNVRSIVGFLLV